MSRTRTTRAVTDRASGQVPDVPEDVAARLAAAVAAYEITQRNRVATGELLRSLLQARCAGATPGQAPDLAADATLHAIRAGRSQGPLPLLGELYHQESSLERACAREMEALVAVHPAWPWLERVRGIGPTLAARLLARLRIERATTPSSFWRFCGLATIEGEQYSCATCGTVITSPRDRTPPRRHVSVAGAACDGPLRHDAEHAVRVAMRFPHRGQHRSFDVAARSLCHLIGTSFLRRGGRYRAIYDQRRGVLDSRNAQWSCMHRHLAAMRAMEKLFLAHLWMVWAERTGMTVRSPYEVTRRGRAGVLITPFEMLE